MLQSSDEALTLTPKQAEADSPIVKIINIADETKIVRLFNCFPQDVIVLSFFAFIVTRNSPMHSQAIKAKKETG
jgi:hypothetical protein